jgi:hypothetical protein
VLDNGIYDLRYRSAGPEWPECDGDPETGSGLAVLRDGEIIGSDPWGGVFSGRCEFDPHTRLNRLHLRLLVPPGGILITGFSAGPAGAVVDIVGTVAAAPVASMTVDVAGVAVSVELAYVGPLRDQRGPSRRCA